MTDPMLHGTYPTITTPRDRWARIRALTVGLPIDPYGRLSDDDAGDGLNSEGQISQGRADLIQRGEIVGMELNDNNLSAYDPAVVRPGFDLELERMRTGQSGGVWVVRSDRLTRQIDQANEILALARSHGIRIITAGGELDLLTAEGRAAFRNSIVSGQGESEKTGDRTWGQLRQKALQGRNVIGGPTVYGMPGLIYPPPADWDPEDDEPRPRKSRDRVAAERAVLRDVAVRLLAGEQGLTAIARDLNERGVTRGEGRPAWDHDNLRRVLTNPILMGRVMLRSDYHGGPRELVGIINPKRAEPVFDETTWDLLQAIFASRHRGFRPIMHALSGVARCGQCGNTLRGRVERRVSYSDGEPRRTYLCDPLRRNGCGRIWVDARWLDGIVRDAVVAKLSDPRHADALAKRARHVTAASVGLKAEIATATEQLDSLRRKAAGKLRRGDYDAPTYYEEFSAPLLERIGELQTTLAALDGDDATPVATNGVAQAWQQGSAAERRRMVRQVCPELTILPHPGGPRRHTVRRIDWTGASRGIAQQVTS